jgi:hypothetical protein
MRKLIKKILKESDVDWIKNINVDIDMEYLHGYYFRWLGDLYLPNGENVEIRVDRKFWIDDIAKNRVYYSWDERGERLSNSLPWFNEGNNNEIGPKDITESSYDLQWIRDIEVEGFSPREGDYIEIINTGDKEDFLNWVGMYADEYTDGTYGENIKGIVTHVASNTFELTEENTGDTIYFPKTFYDNEQLSIAADYDYTNLNITYKPLFYT